MSRYEMTRFPWANDVEDLGDWRPVAIMMQGGVPMVYVYRPVGLFRRLGNALRTWLGDRDPGLPVREGMGVSPTPPGQQPTSQVP
jgi:hypothetical protein